MTTKLKLLEKLNKDKLPKETAIELGRTRQLATGFFKKWLCKREDPQKARIIIIICSKIQMYIFHPFYLQYKVLFSVNQQI